MTKPYNLDEIDVSKLPLPIRELLNTGGIGGVPYTSIQAIENHLEPKRNEETGRYCTFWMIRTAPIGELGAFMIAKSPWVSPRPDKYLEAIRIK